MSVNSHNSDPAAIIKHNFGRPRVMTWGWPLMIMSLGTAVLFILRCILKDPDLPFPATTITGCSFLMIFGTVLALVFPAVFCARGIEDRPIGHFTGVGTLFLAFLSGIPLVMIRLPLYNMMAWLVLRFTGSSVFPVFFHSEPSSSYETILTIVSDILVPSFGAAIFFFGLLYTRFKSTDKVKAFVVVTLFYTLFEMDFTAVLALIVTGVWCCYLRSRIYNMWAPMLCLISTKLTELYLPEAMARIDIFSVQTHADIGSTYFYSSLPAFFMGMVLILFFIRVLDSFAISVRHEVTGAEDDEILPPFDKSINLSLILIMAVFITIWILIFRGVYL